MLEGLLCMDFCFMLGSRDTRTGENRMKYKFDQIHVESYGLSTSQMIAAAAIKAYLVSLPQSDTKRILDSVISLDKDAVSIDGRKLSDLVDDAVRYSLKAVRQKTELAPELQWTMKTQFELVNGSIVVQTIGTELLDFLYDCWNLTKI